MKLKALGSIENGKLLLYNRNEFSEILKTWKDCSIELTLRSTTKGRSTQQNRYYWGCVLPIVKDALKEQHGLVYSSEDLHEFLKIKLNSVEIHNQDGVVERMPMSTTELSTMEFEEYTENVRRWANDLLGVTIPLPNEQTEMFTK
jgi:hypothetical protein